jgi:hypothetical protein
MEMQCEIHHHSPPQLDQKILAPKGQLTQASGDHWHLVTATGAWISLPAPIHSTIINLMVILQF